MTEPQEEHPEKPFPFNNLYLISGFVSGGNKLWMYLSTLLLAVSGYLVFQLLVFFPFINRLIENGYSRIEIEKKPNLLFDHNALQIDRNWVLLAEMGMFVFAFFALYLGLKHFHKKSLSSVLTGFESFRFKRFWFAFFVWSVLLITFVLVSYAFSPDSLSVNIDAFGLLMSFLVMLVFMPLQTGLEELLFRGYLVQGLSQIFKNGIIPVILTSLLFGLAHMSNPEVDKYGWQIMLTYYVSFALFMGCLSLLDEGLELAIGIHFANNIISSLLISSPNSVVKTYSIFEAKSEDPETEIVGWFVMATLCFFIFFKKYKWKNFNLILK